MKFIVPQWQACVKFRQRERDQRYKIIHETRRFRARQVLLDFYYLYSSPLSSDLYKIPLCIRIVRRENAHPGTSFKKKEMEKKREMEIKHCARCFSELNPVRCHR